MIFVPVRFLRGEENSDQAARRLKRENWKPERGQRHYDADRAFYAVLRGAEPQRRTVEEHVANAPRCKCQIPRALPHTGLCVCSGRIP